MDQEAPQRTEQPVERRTGDRYEKGGWETAPTRGTSEPAGRYVEKRAWRQALELIEVVIVVFFFVLVAGGPDHLADGRCQIGVADQDRRGLFFGVARVAQDLE